jgi:two-component system response regulator AtoC
MEKSILIIDDEKFLCMSLKEGLTDLGYKVNTAFNSEDGIYKLTKYKHNIVFLDLKLGVENGLEVLKKIKEIDKDVLVIIMTAYGDIKTAVTAIKNGAFDYINKPLDLDEIQIIIEKALKNLKMQNKIYLLKKEINYSSESIIGEHPSMQEVYNKIDILSKNNEVTVLIRGETGTGKELVSAEIHNKSLRKDEPMVKINCSSIPNHLVESELFGFEKGAFTGAGARKKGLVELAHGGTLFLDEIGELPIEIQAKLLRFLEERKFKRIGGLEDVSVNVRIIAATNKNLEKAIEEKEFREDLYYRLNVIPIHVPPLRERKEDILLLSHHFLNIYNKKFGKNIKGITERAKEQLFSYSWKGNVRELKNVIERIVILYSDEYIDLEHLPLEISKKRTQNLDNNILKCNLKEKFLDRKFSLEYETQKMENEYIQAALDLSENNHSKASQLLGISRFALKRKIEKYSDNK